MLIFFLGYLLKFSTANIKIKCTTSVELTSDFSFIFLLIPYISYYTVRHNLCPYFPTLINFKLLGPIP